MANIKLTPAELSGHGDTLVSKAGELNSMIEEVKTTVNTLLDGWEGAGQSAYFEQFESIRKTLESASPIVEGMGKNAKTAAAAYEETDENIKAGLSS